MKENILINEEKKIAVFIDAENVSVKYIDVIFSEIKKHGDIIYNKMYGDFRNNALSEWVEKSKDYAIEPVLQINYVAGKNLADFKLFNDALEILYCKKNVDIFYIVSSDSDFSVLARTIKENGARVVGMGESKALLFFVNTCNKYICLDNIIDEEENEFNDDTIEEMSNLEIENGDNGKCKTPDNSFDEQHVEYEENAITPIEKIKNVLDSLIIEAENKGARVHLGSTKSQLQREFPDFDERNYGYSAFKKFIEDEIKLKTEQEGSSTYIVIQNDKKIEKNVYDFIMEKAKTGISLGVLGRKIREQFPQFNYKTSGYSRFSKFIESVEGVELYAKTKNQYYIRPKKNNL